MRARAPLAALAVLALLGATRPEGLGDVVELRHWSYDAYTRVVLELSRSADAEAHQLGADPGAGLPARLYFDVPGIWVGRRYAEPIPVGDGLLRRVRVGQNTLHTTRLVLDLERYGHHRVLQLDAPPRLVIDVYGDARAPRGGPRLADDGIVDTVVIDAGHGGRDPGAIGVGGLREKDVTLAMARALRPLLEERGFRVVMTREHDRFVSLEGRTALAEGAGADLFVSLHANAAPRRAAQGVEIYTLDENVERQALRVAARENGVATREVDPLQRLLARLRLSESDERSERLARLVHGEIVGDMGRRWPSVHGPGLKQGPFYVLYLSHVPSILVEAGFVTHRGDAKRLRDPDYVDAMAQAIAAGVVRFRREDAAVVAERGR